MTSIVQAETPDQVESARRLFREYEAWLGLDLCFQGFEEELKNLPGKYVRPDGRLLLALEDGKAAGCVAMRSLEPGICEMKRLYVRPEFQGRGLGKQLIESVIGEARESGYNKLRLDTHPPKMGKAVSIYESLGFKLIPAYYHNPHDDVLFMELELST